MSTYRKHFKQLEINHLHKLRTKIQLRYLSTSQK
jgi:hypothetical protein